MFFWLDLTCADAVVWCFDETAVMCASHCKILHQLKDASGKRVARLPDARVWHFHLSCSHNATQKSLLLLNYAIFNTHLVVIALLHYDQLQ